jgi:hypothetical protein
MDFYAQLATNRAKAGSHKAGQDKGVLIRTNFFNRKLASYQTPFLLAKMIRF